MWSKLSSGRTSTSSIGQNRGTLDQLDNPVQACPVLANSLRNLPARRPAAADRVLEELAREIFAGRPGPGEALASERALAESLGASRVLVRQATHRLADLGLVEVRQGAATRVRDFRTQLDMRLVELIYRLGARLPPELSRAVIQRQYVNGLSLLELAVTLGEPEARRALALEIAAEAPKVRSLRAHDALERRFWLGVARVGGNPISEAELRWWYALVAERMPRPAQVLDTPLPLRVGFLVELSSRLGDGRDALAYYSAVVRPLLRAMGPARPGSTESSDPEVSDVR